MHTNSSSSWTFTRVEWHSFASSTAPYRPAEHTRFGRGSDDLAERSNVLQEHLHLWWQRVAGNSTPKLHDGAVIAFVAAIAFVTAVLTIQLLASDFRSSSFSAVTL